MSEPRQKIIAVTPKEKQKLDTVKRLYEEKTGEQADWGRFLASISVLGLVALGVYKLAQSSKENPTTNCPLCGKRFAIAYSEGLPPIVYVNCPECGGELVVDFREP